MTKRELLARIEALEARLALIEGRPDTSQWPLSPPLAPMVPSWDWDHTPLRPNDSGDVRRYPDRFKVTTGSAGGSARKDVLVWN